ncbi:MAG TPA: NAD(+) synthase [Chloroflexota bacterium]|nr:NAD(+) synthase [Chloroflexota bacterium]
MVDGAYGLVRVGAAVPPLKVTDFAYNREQTLALWRRADDEGHAVVVFPELGLTGYTAGDLNMDSHLLRSARESLAWLLEQGESLRTVAYVGLPLFVHPGVYNCAVAIQDGRILGVTPKAYLPNYGEFYERRQFRDGRGLPAGMEIELLGQRVPFGLDVLLVASNLPELVVGAEVCEDGWTHISPNAYLASAGATLIGNLSGSPFKLGRGEARHHICWKASGPGVCAFIYVGAGPGESSSDVAFDSHALIYENGWSVAESRRFWREPQLITADVDLELLIAERLSNGTFGDCALDHARPMRRVPFTAHLPESFVPLQRHVERHPFVPKDAATLATRCWEVFEIQTNALITRMQHFGNDRLVLALSGGRDSTLAALACVNALDQLKLPRENLLCVSMPGLGTTAQTRDASRQIAEALGASFEEEDIREETYLILRDHEHRSVAAYLQWLNEHRDRDKAPTHSVDKFVQFLSHHPEVADVELENIQARIRKLRVLTKANRFREPGHYALEIGTGDLSEKALGWSTYAGDHIAMYDLNPGIPKTLVEFVIRWVANERVATWAADPSRPGQNEVNAAALRQALFDVLEAPISPELLPASTEGRIAQLTEKTLGPYELNDFFLYWLVRHRARPARIAFYAEQVFADTYPADEIRKWLTQFFRRFFHAQWKRDCTADGPKVGAVALSPRGDWRMPSDAVVTSWLKEIEQL